jgi:signal transduction histidine kinase
MNFHLDQTAIDGIFPFYLLIDRELRIRETGPVLRRILPSWSAGDLLSDHFEIRHPVACRSFDDIATKLGSIFILAARRREELVLRGQILATAGQDKLFFLGSPWITDHNVLSRLGLTVRDYALHDPAADFMFLIQAQKTSLEEAQVLATKLRDARDDAIRASQVKSEFLANMSHELRTPLNAIIGFSEALTEQILGPLPPRYLAYAQDIRASGIYLQDLINDILDLARIEAGRYEIESQPVALTSLLEECMKLVQPEAARKALTLELRPETGFAEVSADRRALKQVFLNILSNAVKFCGNAGRVAVRVRPQADRGIEVTISDTGAGIPSEVMSQLFQPFRQANSGVARKYGGTGLGLSICKKLIELHGGTIGIDSQLGVGTIVSVRLPATLLRQAS